MEQVDSPSGSKKLQYAILNEELAKLDQNLKRFEKNVKEAVEQVPSFLEMGTLHASIFMSVKPVMEQQSTSR